MIPVSVFIMGGPCREPPVFSYICLTVKIVNYGISYGIQVKIKATNIVDEFIFCIYSWWKIGRAHV